MDASKVETKSEGKTNLKFLESGVAVIFLGEENESVVTLTGNRLKSLAVHLKQLSEKPPKGLIITGPKKGMFTVGADINLIKNVTDAKIGESLAKQGQDVFAIIEKLPCTTVAAISGPCVGGGCELALACDYRIITDEKNSLIGLPEIKLGILPGFGGTQRLPRLIGLPKALDIILAGKTKRSKQAYEIGLCNEVVRFEQLMVRADAIAAGTVKMKKPRVSLVDKILSNFAFTRNFVKSKAETTVAKTTKGFYPAPPAALAAIMLGLEKGTQEGYPFEAKELGKLIVSPESKSLIRIFFLTEGSKSIGKTAKKAIEHVHSVVVGAGAMGAGIAGVLAKNECSVILKDTSDASLERGMNQIRSYLNSISYLDHQSKSFILNRIEATTKDSKNLGNSNIAIEAIFEDMNVKKQVLGDLAALMPEDAIIASNTSSLSISEIADSIPNPARVIGMHFFNPVEKMPLVEIVMGNKTTDKTIAIVGALSSKLGKFPIVVKDVPGFLVNRTLTPYLNEALRLLEEGYSIKDIDSAASRFGMPMGPIRLLDEVGLDVATHVSAIMLAGYGERMKAPELSKKLLALGRKGRKSGKGFYDFSDKKPVPAADISEVLGITKTKDLADLSDIQDRLILSLINEAVRCLDEGVAGAPGKEAANQIDLGTVMGMGFPPFRGGVLNYAEGLGASKIKQSLDELAKKYGKQFEATEGIISRAKSGKGFLA
ncbi:MAG: enoyl-CoA hydratase/isomerase family protein [Bdellovibrionales bacterium]|nr:enoyl-CoA hydratase/isomerase family protein [Bdellovibrionales bacterium]